MSKDLEQILGEVWDDGNSVGLDGWIGPGRGEPIDSEAMRCRDRAVRKSADELFSDEAVERSARALYERLRGSLDIAGTLKEWGDLSDVEKTDSRMDARAVIVALLGVGA